MKEREARKLLARILDAAAKSIVEESTESMREDDVLGMCTDIIARAAITGTLGTDVREFLRQLDHEVCATLIRMGARSPDIARMYDVSKDNARRMVCDRGLSFTGKQALKKYVIPKRTCSICGDVKRIAKKLDDGGAACHACYQRTMHAEQCAMCGESKRVALRNEDGTVVCHKCNQRRVKRKA